MRWEAAIELLKPRLEAKLLVAMQLGEVTEAWVGVSDFVHHRWAAAILTRTVVTTVLHATAQSLHVGKPTQCRTRLHRPQGH